MNTHAVVDQSEAVERLTSTPQSVVLQPGQSLVALFGPVPAWPDGAGTLKCDQNGRLYWDDDRSIEELRASKNAEINHWRETANETFEHSGKTFSADPLSWKDIAGAHGWIVATGAMPPGWPGAWKAVDNTLLPIATTLEWMAFYGAAVSTGAANFARSQALKAYMNDPARTRAEIDSITWNMEIPT